jgi:serine/threonine protein kinase
MPLNNGDAFAGYTIVRRLGSGGMGEVYLAQHPRLPRRDALKVLPAALTADRDYRQRFSREADIAAELWHPHIVETRIGNIARHNCFATALPLLASRDSCQLSVAGGAGNIRP